MPLARWFAKTTPSRSVPAWVGVQVQAGRFLLARSDASRQGRRPRILACQSAAVDSGLAALRGWWRGQAHKRDRTALLLDVADYQILQIQAPAVAPHEYRAAARWLIKDQIDFPVEQAALDCFAIPGDAGTLASRLHTVVARQQLVNRTVAEWRGAGVQLQAIDIPELALRNLALLSCGDLACAFLHIGIDDARLLLLWQSEMCVSRLLPFGGRALRSLDDAQRVDHAERLALEVQRSVDAFGRQFSAAHLSQLWVSSVHDAAGLTAALAGQVSLQVQAFEPADWIDFDDAVCPFDLDAGLDHTLAIGAALREGA